MKPTSPPASRAPPAIPARPLGAGVTSVVTKTEKQFGGSNVGAGIGLGSAAASPPVTAHTGLRTGFSKIADVDAPAQPTVSGPTNVQRVLHVEWDSSTGTFKGMPEVWKAALPEGVAADSDYGDAVSAALPEHVAPTAPVKKYGGGVLGALGLVGEARGPTALHDGGGGYSMFVSAPFNVKHNIHVQVDPSAPTGFTGLPREWDAMLSVSGISKAEVSANPQAVLSALQFHMEGPPPKLPKKVELGALVFRGGEGRGGGLKYKSPGWSLGSVDCRGVHMTPANTHSPAERDLDEASFISRGDPTAIFTGLVKLGEGASGQVFSGVDRASGKTVAIKVAPASDLQVRVECHIGCTKSSNA